MARERFVTRTIENAILTVMCANTNTAQVENHTVKISNTIPEKDRPKYLAKNAKVLFEVGIVPVQIIETKVEITLYGMPEVEFIEHAQILPPRFTAEAETAEEVQKAEKKPVQKGKKGKK